MKLKNILVAFSGSEQSKTALAFAAVMAKENGAHITGILTHGLPAVLFSYGAHLPQTAMDQLEEADKDHRNAVREEFMQAGAGIDSSKLHFLDVFGDADEKLMEIARSFDIVFMGSADKDSNYPHMEVHPDVVARSSGRPVIVVPDGYQADSFNNHVVMAWDGRRAAAHALSNAMCVMGSAGRFTVLNIGKTSEVDAKTGMIMAHLERHGIQADLVHKKRKGGKISKIILETVKEADAGMLVMGAYEHSKIAEDLFGGVTNRILNHAKVPVLMAH